MSNIENFQIECFNVDYSYFNENIVKFKLEPGRVYDEYRHFYLMVTVKNISDENIDIISPHTFCHYYEIIIGDTVLKFAPDFDIIFRFPNISSYDFLKQKQTILPHTQTFYIPLKNILMTERFPIKKITDIIHINFYLSPDVTINKKDADKIKVSEIKLWIDGMIRYVLPPNEFEYTTYINEELVTDITRFSQKITYIYWPMKMLWWIDSEGHFFMSKISHKLMIFLLCLKKLDIPNELIYEVYKSIGKFSY